MTFAFQLLSSTLGGFGIHDALVDVTRLVAALILGGVLGYERRKRQKVAGIRTQMVISLASCLITIVGVRAAGEYGHSDPLRMGAQILSGIGFIGAGVILRQGLSTIGVTTAATILLVTGIGMACGCGQIGLAIAVTVLEVISMALVSKYLPLNSPQADPASEGAPIKFSCRPERFAEIRGLLGENYKLMSIARRDDVLKVTVGTNLSPEQREQLLDRMISTSSIISMETTEAEAVN
jgi:putative Mg2+ transporter-C (MgtC) family protein